MMSELHSSTALSTSPLPDPDELISKPRVPRALLEAGLVSRPVEYAEVWRAIARGAVPTEPLAGNREGVRRRNLPIVAKALRLTQDQAAA